MTADPTRELAAQMAALLLDIRNQHVLRKRLKHLGGDELIVEARFCECGDEMPLRLAPAEVAFDQHVAEAQAAALVALPPADANGPGLRAGVEALVEKWARHEQMTRRLGRLGKTAAHKMDAREANVWNVAQSDLRALLVTQPDKAEGEA